MEYALNYLRDMGESLEASCRGIQTAPGCGLKIKCSKCEFFKSKVHFLGYLVGTDGIQPLPEKVAIIEALEPPLNIDELQHFLGLIRFYRKFIPFFTNVTACLNTMLRRGAVFKWTEQCNNEFII